MSQDFNNLYEAGKRFDRLPSQLVDDPWRTVNEYFEGFYPKVGRRVFAYASLQAVSAFAPRFRVKGEYKRIAISILLLGNSGSGKSSLMSEVEDITPRSYFVSQESEANMEQELANMGQTGVTVVVNDMKRVLGDSGRIKAIESMIGDGRISRKNMEYSAEGEDLSISMIGGAVPSDVTKQIGGGLLFRMVPIVLQYRKKTNNAGQVVEDEAAEVGRNIIMDAGEGHEMNLEKNDIARYYDTLVKIAAGEMTDVKKPVGYVFEEDKKKPIFDMWNNLRNERDLQRKDLNWYRELIDGLRFACLSAFLNYPNRAKVNVSEDEARIKLKDEDVERATRLMKAEMLQKYKYAKKMNMLDEFGQLDELVSQNTQV